jgi:hypothetical protein
VRCSPMAFGEKKYYLANVPAEADLRTLAASIKTRWICEQAHGLRGTVLATPCAHDNDRLRLLQHRRLTAARREKRSTDHHLSQACQPCNTRSSISSFDRFGDAHTAEDGSAQNGGVNQICQSSASPSGKFIFMTRIFAAPQRQQSDYSYGSITNNTMIVKALPTTESCLRRIGASIPSTSRIAMSIRPIRVFGFPYSIMLCRGLTRATFLSRPETSTCRPADRSLDWRNIGMSTVSRQYLEFERRLLSLERTFAHLE